MTAWNSKELIARFVGFPAASVYEAAGAKGDVGPDIFSMVDGVPLLGPAYTVKCWPGDAKGLWEALSRAPKGSVIVADMGGFAHVTALGGGTAKSAIARGIAGIVTNAAVRDTAELRMLGLPVFAMARSLRGTKKTHGGTHGSPIAIGSAVCCVGDLVVGDDDGVVVVPSADVIAVAERLQSQREKETSVESRFQAGEDPLDVLQLR